jgi:hypothetical protein
MTLSVSKTPPPPITIECVALDAGWAAESSQSLIASAYLEMRMFFNTLKGKSYYI